MGYRSEIFLNIDNALIELETIYGYVKQNIFQQNKSNDVVRNANIAHHILKTIIACIVEGFPTDLEFRPNEMFMIAVF